MLRFIHNLMQRPIVAHVSLVLLCLISVLPLVQPYHDHPFTSFYSEWIAFALGFAACVAFVTRDFWAKFTIPRTALYFLGFLLLVTIQGLLIPRPYLAQTLMPGIYLAWAALLAIVAWWLRATIGADKVVMTIAWFLLIGAVLQAFAGVVQYLGIPGALAALVAIKSGPTVYGNVAQANHFGTHLTLGIAAVVFLFAQNRLSLVSTISLVSFLSLTAGLAGSRSIALYAAAAIVLSAIRYWRKRDVENCRLLWGSLYFLTAFVCAQYVIAQLNPLLAEKLAFISQNPDPFTYLTAMDRLPDASSGLELRTSEWRKTGLMFAEAPVLGVGFGNYGWHSFVLQALPEFRAISKPLLFSHSHNLLTQLLAETGAIGFGLFMLFAIGWVRNFRTHWESSYSWMTAIALLVLFIHSNLEFPLWYSYFLGLAAVLLALGDSNALRATFSPGLGRTAALMSLTLISSTLLTTLWSFKQISQLPAPSIEPQEQINMLLTHGSNPILKPYAEILLTAIIPLNKDSVDDKVAITTRTFHRNPDSFKSYKQATLLALSGHVNDAETLLAKLAQIYPTSLTPYLESLKELPDPETQQLREYGARLVATDRLRLTAIQIPTGKFRDNIHAVGR